MKTFSGQDRVDLTRALFEMLEDWGLNSSQTIHVLGLPEKTPARKLLQYRNDYPLPEDEQVNMHIEHLLGIADALRTMHPTNAQMGARWMRQPCRQFGGRPPLQVICESDGASGLVAVRSQIDCTFAWNLSGSNG